MNENPQSSSTNNEIDLLTLLINGCKAIGHGIALAIKGIGKAIVACFNFCLRHFFWLLGGAVSGLLIIILTSRLSEKGYMTGEAVLICPGTSLHSIETEINKLNNVILGGNSDAISAILNINASLAKTLKNIEFGVGIDLDNDNTIDFVEYNKSKTQNIYTEKTLKGGTNGDRIVKEPVQKKVSGFCYLKITAESTTSEKFKEAGHAICDYLNRLPQLQKQLQLNRRVWEANIAEMKTQKALLDSMLQIEYFEISRMKAASFAHGADKLVLSDHQKSGTPIDYKDILKLVDEWTILENQLEKTQQVVTIQSDFLPVSSSMRTQKTAFGLIWMGIFLVVALIYEQRKPIGAYIRQQRQK